METCGLSHHWLNWHGPWEEMWNNTSIWWLLQELQLQTHPFDFDPTELNCGRLYTLLHCSFVVPNQEYLSHWLCGVCYKHVARRVWVQPRDQSSLVHAVLKVCTGWCLWTSNRYSLTSNGGPQYLHSCQRVFVHICVCGVLSVKRRWVVEVFARGVIPQPLSGKHD